MTETDLLRAVNGASDQQLSHSERARPGRRLPVLLTAAACAALFLLFWPRGGTELAPGVTLRYEDPDVSMSAAFDLAYFTEEELLFPRQWEQAVFQGQVTSVRNLSLDFNGSKVWRALADIRVSRVWQGDVQAGETVSVLLPCPVAEGAPVAGSSGSGMSSADRVWYSSPSEKPPYSVSASEIAFFQSSQVNTGSAGSPAAVQFSVRVRFPSTTAQESTTSI